MTRKPSTRTRAMHRRKVQTAHAAWDTASSAVTSWAIANGFGNVRYNDLRPVLAAQVPALVAAEHKAREKLDAAENAAIDAWCAYRGTFGLLSWIQH